MSHYVQTARTEILRIIMLAILLLAGCGGHGTLLYTSNEDVSGASVVDIAAGKILDTVKVGEEPEGVATSPDGRFVYVTSEEEGTISVIDTAARKVIKEFEVGHRPRDVAFFPHSSKASPDNKFLYSANGPSNDVSVVDLATRTVIKRIWVGDSPWGLIVLEP